MPAVDYDYSYDSARRSITKTTAQKRVDNKSNSYSSMPSKGTRQSTKAQVRMATSSFENKKRQTKKNTALEIPNIKSTKTNVTKKKQTTNKKNALKPAEMKLKKPEVSDIQKKKEKQKVISRIKNVIYIGLAFSIAFLICYRYSLINEKFNEIESAKSALAVAQTVNEQIQAEIDSQTDLSYIENYAKYQLGMQKPSNSQIVYVNVEKKDRILTPVTIEEDTEKTWFEQLYGEILKLFD